MSHLFRRKPLLLKALPWLFVVCVCSFVSRPTVAAEQLAPSQAFAKCWEYQSAPDLRVGPVSDENSVYFLDTENKVVGVQLSGAKLWSAELGGEVVSNLLIAGDSIVIVTSIPGSSTAAAKGVLWSLSRNTGVTEWRRDISASPAVALGRSAGNILAVGSDGVVSALSRAGELLWRIETGSPLSSDPKFDDAGAAVGTTKNEVINIASADGRRNVLWRSVHAPTAVYLNSRTRLLVGDERGNLFSLPVGSSPSWRFRNGARISKVMGNRFGYVAISDDNFVYNLSRSGDVKWKRRLPGRAAGTPLVLTDVLVVPVVGTGEVYVLALKNGKVLNRIETGDETSAGVAGRPDGHAFLITGGNRVSYFSRSKCPAAK